MTSWRLAQGEPRPLRPGRCQLGGAPAPRPTQDEINEGANAGIKVRRRIDAGNGPGGPGGQQIVRPGQRRRDSDSWLLEKHAIVNVEHINDHLQRFPSSTRIIKDPR